MINRVNYDNRRNSGFVHAMDNFLQKIGLLSVWDKCAIDFTQLHTDLQSSSILDNFFLNPELLDLNVDAGPVHLGDNLSRHSPIMIKLELGSMISRSTSKSIPRPRIPAWLKATEEDKNFTFLLDDLVIPESLLCADVRCKNKSHSMERGSFLLDIMTSVIKALMSVFLSPTKLRLVEVTQVNNVQ